MGQPKSNRAQGASRGRPRSRNAAQGEGKGQQGDRVSAALGAVKEGLEDGVVISSERLQETIDDAVERGRITRGDGEDLVARLFSSGRKQTEDLLGLVEQALDRGRSGVVAAARGTTRRVGGERAVRQVDRVLRAAGLPTSFPIVDYDELTAAAISSRVSELDAPAALRTVRDYERRHGNRKSVLEAVERRLSKLGY
jgi:hypothetical protein